MSDIVQAEAKELIDSIDQMAALSPAATKIISISSNLNAEPADLVNAINMDPLLMGKVLKLVNSAYFGLGKAIVSLQRAVILLGFNTIKNIALSAAMTSSINVQSSFKSFNNEQFWEHSVACSILAKAMAKKMAIPAIEVEEYFVSGLMHDIGKVVLISKHAVVCEEIYEQASFGKTVAVELEEERFGISHATLGARIASKWRFPETMCNAVEFHHTPEKAPDDRKKMAYSIHFANKMAHNLKIGIETSSDLDTISDEAMEGFPLSPSDMDELTEDLPKAVEEAKSFLRGSR